MKDKKLIVGYDIGITSVGWCVASQEKSKLNLVDFGVRHFDEADQSSDCRIKRSARRTKTRRKWRLNQLIDAFDDFNIISKEEINKKGYKEFSSNHKNKQLDESLTPINSKEIPTIYHLRKRD